ncbi:MAG: AAA family ATPase [Thermoanaerobaculia bacterium]
MDRLIIENVRCFRGRHEVPLAPLTILVGENSTGKSTVLAMARLAWDVASGKRTQFNEEPFLLGSYEQIASLPRTGSRHARRFTIGCEWSKKSREKSLPSSRASVTGSFVSQTSQPALKTWSFESNPFELKAEFDSEENLVSLELGLGSRKVERKLREVSILPGTMRASWTSTMLQGEPGYRGASPLLKRFMRVSQEFENQLGPRPYAFAPIRSRPQRVYESIKLIESSEGGHVPLALARIHLQNSAGWDSVQGGLEKFGKTSGLFDRVDIRRLGSGESDPFQLQVSIAGRLANVVDVGYGVSQILPILVDCLSNIGGTLLLQQPEVHLHPKAQAELGSFLGLLAKHKTQLLVETHSDYLVDRIRIDVRDKRSLRPEDVALLYFEREEGEVRIHRLDLDEHGDIVNAPPSYRKFILQEERRFLGI